MAADVLPIVLVHGAWHGAWSWSALQHALDGRGFPSYVLDLPGRGASPDPPSGLDGDISAVIASVRAVGRPVVLVGHSYGGAVVSGAAASEPLVAAVIYVAAFALVAGESVMGFLRSRAADPVGLSVLMRPQPDGSIVLDPDRAGQIYGGGLAEPELRAHIARLGPNPPTRSRGRSAATRSAASRRATCCASATTVHPEHQRIMAACCDRTIALDSDHFPMLHSAERSPMSWRR